MRIPSPIILLGYVIIAALTIRGLTGMREENIIGTYLLLAVAVIGLFIVVAYIAERDHQRDPQSIIKRSARTGINTFFVWFLFIAAFSVIGCIIAVVLRL